MAFATHKDTPGRQAANILELDLDYCSRSYGVSPCTADLALQNFIIRSQELDNAAWAKVAATVSANVENDPLLGALTVDEVIEDATASAQHRVSDTTQTSDFLDNEVLTLSAYVKQGVGVRNPHLLFASGSEVLRATFDLANGTLLGTSDEFNALVLSANIYPVPGAIGWFRISLTGQIDPNSSGTTSVNYSLQMVDGITIFYDGDNTSSLRWFGAQLRRGFLPGKYAVTTSAIVDGMGVADDLCFNTFGTCQDTANYLKAIPPSGTPIDYNIVEKDLSIDISNASWADVSGFVINQANLVNGDDYLILVNSHLTHSASSSLNTNYVRLVDESDALMPGSEYRFEAVTANVDDEGLAYQYVNWITAAPGVGDGLIQMQAQQTTPSGAVSINGFRAFSINLTQIGTNNYARDRNTAGVAISSAAWSVVETITLPSSAGDYVIFGCVQCSGFGGNSAMPTRIRVDAATTLIQSDHDIEDSTGLKVHARWTVLQGASGGESITLEQTAIGGITYNNVFASLVAIRLDVFAAHFIVAGDPIDPANNDVYDALSDTYIAPFAGDYLFFASLIEDWSGSGKSGQQRVNLDIDEVGMITYAGDHVYASDHGQISTHNKQVFPNSSAALQSGSSVDVSLNVNPAASFGNNELTNGVIWGFVPTIASPDSDRTLRFIDTLQRPYQFLDYYPNILSIRYASTVLKPGGNLSIRGQVTVTLQDFATTDNKIDDYVRERSYNPEDQGTFFGKLKARSQYYIGRPMRVLEGYLDDASLSDFRQREYIIDDISGPTASGQVVIKGKDILSLAADVRAKCPTASTGTVAVAVTVGAGSVTVSTGDGAQYDPTTVDKHIRINDEIMRVDSRATDVLTVTRGQGGTDPAAHEIGDGIQACKTYEDTPVIDVVQDLLENFANIPASFIPYTDWQAEEAESLSGYDMETIITEPSGVLSLLKEIAEITLIDLWYDDVDQEIKLKLQTPFTEVTETVNDNEDILKDSLKVRDLNNQRLTRVLIYYGIRNYAEKLKDAENFSFINFEIEADKESANKYNDERIKVIYSRWFDSTNATQVALTSTRLLDRFGITPKQIVFNLDAKDVERLKTGDVFDVISRIEQDIDGTDATNRYQVIESKALRPSSQYMYKADAFFQDPQADSLTINSDEVDYDIFVELGGPPGPVDVTLTINSTFTVSATNGNPAIKTEGMHPDSTLRIVNNGDVKGYGGNAAKGGNVSGRWDFEPGMGCIGGDNGYDGDNGQSGGDAIDTTLDITIDNANGNIWAGAGGGGGGGADSTFNDYGGGGGGGGGIGTDTGNLGVGGVANVIGLGPGCSVTNTDGSPGTVGSGSAAGTGGLGGGNGGDGGDGGADWGDDGDDGQDGVEQVKGTGGPGGYAVRLNGNAIVWEGGFTAAKVKGDVA